MSAPRLVTEPPPWMPVLAQLVREVKLPAAQLADAMRNAGEDPRDEVLWSIRIDQLDIALFGCPGPGAGTS
jgi:hypothetical protein